MSTSSPLYSTQIYGSSSEGGIITVSGSNTNSGGDVYINPTGGKTGIGTNNPTNTLSISGSCDFSGKVGIAITNPTNALSVNGVADFSSNVGIGTSTPGQSVNMIGGLTINGTGATQLTIEHNSKPGLALAVQNDGSFAVADYVNNNWNASFVSQGGSVYFYNNVVVNNTLNTQSANVAGTLNSVNANIQSSLNVQGSLNASSATIQGTLTINGSNMNYTGGNYIDNGHCGVENHGFNKSLTANVSINSAGYHLAARFSAVSDERIKKDIKKTNQLEDLNTLQKIEVMDYLHKDEILYGSGYHKKVIGQQIEQVYPNAVSYSKKVIPDIFKPAEKVFFDVANQQIILTIENHGLIADENILVISENEQKTVTIQSVTYDTLSFSSEKAEAKFFVYGREVSDFRVVDYDALAMLNVSATQALAEKVEKVEMVNKNLMKRLSKLEAILSKSTNDYQLGL